MELRPAESDVWRDAVRPAERPSLVWSVDGEGDVRGAVPTDGVGECVGGRPALLAHDEVIRAGRLEEGDPWRPCGGLAEVESRVAVERDAGLEVGDEQLPDVVDVRTRSRRLEVLRFGPRY